MDSDPNAPTTTWTNAFDGAGGILAGGALGYRFTASGRLRLELEYFYRETSATTRAGPWTACRC